MLFRAASASISASTGSRAGIKSRMYASIAGGVIPGIVYDPSMKIDAVLFDAAETLFTTRGSVGEIYGEVARQFGSTTPSSEIQAAFVRQFRHSGPLAREDEKEWWK